MARERQWVLVRRRRFADADYIKAKPVALASGQGDFQYILFVGLSGMTVRTVNALGACDPETATNWCADGSVHLSNITGMLLSAPKTQNVY